MMQETLYEHRTDSVEEKIGLLQAAHRTKNRSPSKTR